MRCICTFGEGQLESEPTVAGSVEPASCRFWQTPSGLVRTGPAVTSNATAKWPRLAIAFEAASGIAQQAASGSSFRKADRLVSTHGRNKFRRCNGSKGVELHSAHLHFNPVAMVAASDRLIDWTCPTRSTMHWKTCAHCHRNRPGRSRHLPLASRRKRAWCFRSRRSRRPQPSTSVAGPRRCAVGVRQI